MLLTEMSFLLLGLIWGQMLNGKIKEHCNQAAQQRLLAEAHMRHDCFGCVWVSFVCRTQYSAVGGDMHPVGLQTARKGRDLCDLLRLSERLFASVEHICGQWSLLQYDGSCFQP